MNTIQVRHKAGEYKSSPHIVAVPENLSIFVSLFVHHKCFTYQLYNDSWNCPLYNSDILSHNALLLYGLYGLQQCRSFSGTGRVLEQ